MHKRYLIIAALLGAVSVALGAFAAHGLKNVATEQVITVFETGVKYQLYHVFALLATGILYNYFTNKNVKNAGLFFIAGIVLFSGSLYLYTLKEVMNIPSLSWVVFITPLGGVTFIIGWILLALGIKK
ncbi:MAG: DUF423 domain-containing protein [Chitinophagaceae bacterium]|nr:DUF423 domain-containing protein [Chitinophagaceae bacterium]MCW5905255.1 DUF423 domain-containing protein [Chitinophagaceae bacterium]